MTFPWLTTLIAVPALGAVLTALVPRGLELAAKKLALFMSGVTAILGAIAAALRFTDPADAEATDLAGILASSSPADATARITGLEPEHPLFNAVATLVEERQAEAAKAPA